MLSFAIEALRRRGGGEVQEDPFRKGMRLFGKNKFQEAIELFSRLNRPQRRAVLRILRAIEEHRS